MKAILSSILFILLVLNINAQVQMNSETKLSFHRIQKVFSQKTNSLSNLKSLQHEYPIQAISEDIYVSCIALKDKSFRRDELEQSGYLIGSEIGNIITIRVPLSAIGNISQLKGITYLEMAEKVKPNLDKAVKDVRADSVHMGIQLPSPFTGKDVFIGITDWGFDYTHPMFYDTTYSNTRIFAAWDQFKQSGPAPQGFNYGTEYSTPFELFAAGSDTSNIYKLHYHGTHVAGICGGSGATTPYRGVAFDSQYLLATFLVDLSAVLDAFSWMKQKADTEGKRLVINMSWGLYYMGNLDGTSLLSQAIDSYAAQGVVFVSSAGNNGDVNFHIKKTFNQDTLKTKIDFYPYSANANMWGQSITMWGTPGNPFSSAAMILNNSNQIMAQTPFYHTSLNEGYIDTILVVGADTLFYNISIDSANFFNQRPHMRFRVKNKNTSLKIALKSYADQGTVHYWNVTELSNDVGNWGMPFSSLGTGWTVGNKEYGIGEPACAENVISVAAYTSEYYTPSGNLAGGQSATFSSFGPLINGTMKPDIAAPGVSVASSISSFTNASYTPNTNVNFQSVDYPFARLSGTSMSSPIVAGVVALMLDANPWLMPAQIKQILKETAREDAKTGNIPDTGSVKWGWGKVHAWRAVWQSVYNASVESALLPSFFVYPNPAIDNVYIVLPPQLNSSIFRIVDISGKVWIQNEFKNDIPIPVDHLSIGLYYIQILTEEGTWLTSKLIKT